MCSFPLPVQGKLKTIQCNFYFLWKNKIKNKINILFSYFTNLSFLLWMNLQAEERNLHLVKVWIAQAAEHPCIIIINENIPVIYLCNLNATQAQI